MSRNLIVFILILITFYSSCKKDNTDKELPKINITNPKNYTIYSVLDTIYISAEIFDNEIITKVSVYLLDSKAQIVSSLKSFTANKNKYTLNTYIILDDIRMESGRYDITISASDKYNNKKKYKSIYITSITRKLERIYIILGNNKYSEVYTLDSNNNLILKYNLNEELNDAKINSYYNSLYILTKKGNLLHLSSNSYDYIWENHNLNTPPYEYKGKLLIYDDLCFVSKNFNQIAGYDFNNIVKKTAISVYDDYLPWLFCIHNDYIISCTYSHGIGKDKLEEFYYSTGNQVSSININFKVIDIMPSYDNSVLVFGNNNKKTIINVFYLKYNTFQEIYSIDNEYIKSVCKINNKNFIFSSFNDIYLFNSETQNAYIIKQDFSADKIFYDDLNELVYCVYNSKITIFSLPYFQEISNINCKENVKKILFDYNF